MAELEQQIDRILLHHREGARRLDQTRLNLENLYGRILLSSQPEFFAHLTRVFEQELELGRWEEQIGFEKAQVARVIVWSFADFGPFDGFIGRLFVLFRFTRGLPNDQSRIDFWYETFREVGSRVQFNWATVPQVVLDQIKAECRSIRKLADQWLSLKVVEVFQLMERQVEEVEFLRFEKSLEPGPQTSTSQTVGVEEHAESKIPPGIERALDKARSYLRSDGEFDPKIAADLLRTSIDASHSHIVDILQAIAGRRCQGGKDGSRRAFMKDVGFITASEEKFFSAIYTLLSEEGSHKLTAPRETVLVLETVVGGYVLLLFRRLESWSSPIESSPGA